MEIIEQSQGKLVLKDKPGCFWVFYSFFLCFGLLFIYGLSGGFTNLNEITLWGKILAWIMAFSLVSVGIAQIHKSPGSTVTFDSTKGKVFINRAGLWNKSEIELPLSDIDEIFLEETGDIDGDPVHRMAIKLKSGESVPLSTLWLHNRESQEKNKEIAMEFIGRNRNQDTMRSSMGLQ